MSNLLTSQLVTLTTLQVKALKASQVMSLPPPIKFTFGATGQIPQLATDVIKALTTAQVNSLTIDQVTSLTATQLSALTATQVNSLQNTRITTYLDVSKIKTLTLAGMSISKLLLLNQDQIWSLSTDQWAALGRSKQRAILAGVGSPGSVVKSYPKP